MKFFIALAVAFIPLECRAQDISTSAPAAILATTPEQQYACRDEYPAEKPAEERMNICAANLHKAGAEVTDAQVYKIGADDHYEFFISFVSDRKIFVALTKTRFKKLQDAVNEAEKSAKDAEKSGKKFICYEAYERLGIITYSLAYLE